VNAAINNEVAHYGQKNQNIYAGIKHVLRKRVLRETAKARGSERARCDQHQAAMELRLLAPINGQREWDDERSDVPQRNDQDSIAIRKAVMREVEACHHDGSRDAYDGNRED